MMFNRLFIVFICTVFISISPIVSGAQSQETIIIIKQFNITGDNPIGDKAYDIVNDFIGIQSIEGLSKVTQALDAAIKEAGFGFHRVNLPPQKLSNGIVELEVVRFTIGYIDFIGNNHFSNINILRTIPNLIVDETPNTTDISRAVKFANKHPSKQISVEFHKGQGDNEIDSLIHTVEGDPQLIYLTLENSGANSTEALRSTFFYQHSNLFDKDHVFTFLYTTAPKDPESANQYAIRYQLPLYSQQAHLNFLFAKSESSSGSLTDDTLITGRGRMSIIEYSQQLNSIDSFEHRLSYAFHQKLFDNEIFAINRYVLSAPLQLGYHFSDTRQARSYSGGIDLTYNTESGTYNDADSYEQARTGASPSWNAIHYYLNFDYTFSNQWRFYGEFGGQNSASVLIPGEQFGMGGARTLRGFEESSLSGDSGTRYRLEIWSPKQLGNISYSTFYDLANIEINSTTSISNDGYQLSFSSIGVGLHWAWQKDLTLDAHYAQIVASDDISIDINQVDDQKVHFKLIYTF